MGFVVFVVIGLAVAGAVYQRSKTVNRCWHSAGASLGLQVTPGKVFRQPSMVGEYHGFPVKVDTVTQGSGKNSTTYTRYRVRHGAVGPPVVLSQQIRLGFLGRFFNRGDVDIGDPFFDDKVKVETDDPAAVAAFLTPSRRAAVLELFSNWPVAKITQSSVELLRQGVEAKPTRLQSTVIRLVDTAAVMAAPSEVDHILERQAHGDLGGAADELHRLNQARPNVFTELLEAEALVELGRHDEAAAVFDDVGNRLDGDPAVPEWKRVAELPSPPPSPALSTPPVTRDLAQQSVIDDLFAANRMSWEMVEYFESTYHGAAVSWRGEVTAHNTYRHDSDFGEGPGVKATVLLGGVGKSDFISNEVHAVVQLPDETELERGATVSIEGTLAHVDRFSRKIYVHRARLS